ncbi:hypothetical protein [Achromobacter insolitus]|uniref:hypothetical protein n=1 Tax=Achromobacter insolitus TaxID=217204 RepID=UPI0027E05653|nr:hypothetical protein [Achromobacter insolitus]MDQ6212339.1 hypothetical protein [Achromobacter insolitus]
MDIPGFLSGITFAANAYKAAVELKDEAQIAAATYDLQAQLAIAGAHCIAMNEKASTAADRERAAQTRVHELEDRIRQLEKRISERERYELVQNYPGTFTLRLKEAARGSEPLHYICPTCMDNRSVKSILQGKGGANALLTCHECQTRYRFADTPRDGYALT